MRQKAVALSALLILSLALPATLFSSEQQWRQRGSAQSGETGEITGSDIEEEIRFGREVAAMILGRMGFYDNPAITRYVNLVGQSVALNANRPEIEFHFAVLDSAEINAYAAPGGYIFITKGALGLARDESELAGVLAHEIAHVTERHIVKELNIQATEESPVAGFARLIGGGSESARLAFHQAAEKAIEILFTNGYKREDEIQADTTSVMFAALTGYDPSGLPGYLTRLSGSAGKKTEVLDKTHPPHTERIGWINEAIAKGGIGGAGLKSNKERFAEAISALK
ncbi:MAG: M48 family metalloprotease [Thermodesulfovibrionales bacterium]|nr:M48 family metalloprotease [Thermodesulfovibrionales bacterium]